MRCNHVFIFTFGITLFKTMNLWTNEPIYCYYDLTDPYHSFCHWVNAPGQWKLLFISQCHVITCWFYGVKVVTGILIQLAKTHHRIVPESKCRKQNSNAARPTNVMRHICCMRSHCVAYVVWWKLSLCPLDELNVDITLRLRWKENAILLQWVLFC